MPSGVDRPDQSSLAIRNYFTRRLNNVFNDATEPDAAGVLDRALRRPSKELRWQLPTSGARVSAGAVVKPGANDENPYTAMTQELRADAPASDYIILERTPAEIVDARTPNAAEFEPDILGRALRRAASDPGRLGRVAAQWLARGVVEARP